MNVQNRRCVREPAWVQVTTLHHSRHEGCSAWILDALLLHSAILAWDRVPGGGRVNQSCFTPTLHRSLMNQDYFK